MNGRLNLRTVMAMAGGLALWLVVGGETYANKPPVTNFSAAWQRLTPDTFTLRVDPASVQPTNAALNGYRLAVDAAALVGSPTSWGEIATFPSATNSVLLSVTNADASYYRLRLLTP